MILRRGGPPKDMGPGAGVPTRYNRRKYRTKGDLTAYLLARSAIRSFGLSSSASHQTVREAVMRLAVSPAYEGARLFNPDDAAVTKLIYEAEWILWDHLGVDCRDKAHAHAA